MKKGMARLMAVFMVSAVLSALTACGGTKLAEGMYVASPTGGNFVFMNTEYSRFMIEGNAIYFIPAEDDADYDEPNIAKMLKVQFKIDGDEIELSRSGANDFYSFELIDENTCKIDFKQFTREQG